MSDIDPAHLKAGDWVYFPRAVNQQRRKVTWQVFRRWDGVSLEVKTWNPMLNAWDTLPVDEKVIAQVGLDLRRF